MADARTISGISGYSVSPSDGPTLKLDVADSATVKTSGAIRETLTGANDVVGFSEKFVAGFVEVAVYKRGDFKLSDFSGMRSVTSTLIAKDGSMWVANGWVIEAPDYAPMDGTFTLRIEGTVKEVSP